MKPLLIRLFQHLMILLHTTTAWKEKSTWSEGKRKITKKCKESSKNNSKKPRNKLTKKSFHSTKKNSKSKNSNNKLFISKTSTHKRGLKRSKSFKSLKNSTSKVPTQAISPQVNSKAIKYWPHLLPENQKLSTPSLCSSSGSKRWWHQTNKNSGWSTSTRNTWCRSRKLSRKSNKKVTSRTWTKSLPLLSSQNNKTSPFTITWITWLRKSTDTMRKIDSLNKKLNKKQILKGKMVCKHRQKVKTTANNSPFQTFIKRTVT